MVAAFQFHFGTIEGNKPVEQGLCLSQFQFHFGTIEGFIASCTSSLSVMFQFHFGTIEGEILGYKNINHLSFNSTLVRLKGRII